LLFRRSLCSMSCLTSKSNFLPLESVEAHHGLVEGQGSGGCLDRINRGDLERRDLGLVERGGPGGPISDRKRDCYRLSVSSSVCRGPLA
jgi:hypothetical protein